MPSCMIHLSAAAEYNPDMPVRLMIGSVAPDSINKDFKIKDVTHLRNVERESERVDALRLLALSFDMSDDFYVGVILHLYLDCLWDYTALKDFREANNNDLNLWFHPYRNEISIASEWIFHHCGWSRKVWNEMLTYNVADCPCLEHCSCDDLNDYLTRNHRWHVEHHGGPSLIYTPEYVDSFTVKAVSGFRDFMNNIIV